MKKALIIFCTLLATGAATNLSAADAAAGKAKAVNCAACHGAEGISVADIFPNLAGQKAGYLESALKAFRGGDRVNALMSPMAKNLSDKDIANLAAHFSGLKGQ